MKQCKKCGTNKPLTEYGNKTDESDGLHLYCKICVNGEYDSTKYKKYKLNKHYGITPKQYDNMLTDQQGKCAVCGDIMTQPHVDHCHTTGKVRGLLCINCNQGLGKFKDDTNKLQHAIDYLNKFS
jgi:hypothetical protein